MASGFTQPIQSGQVLPLGIGLETTGTTVDPNAYRMRAFDSTLTTTVYWGSSTEDPTGTNYGGPGPLVDVVTIEKPSA